MGTGCKDNSDVFALVAGLSASGASKTTGAGGCLRGLSPTAKAQSTVNAAVTANNAGSPAPAVSSPSRDPADKGVAAVYRIRFFMFNMGNSSHFNGLADLQGPGGRGFFENIYTEPFMDGSAVDVAFSALTETRLNISEYVHAYSAEKRTPLDVLVGQNARREGANHTHWRVRPLMESLAASYNGNLKSLLAFSSETFSEDKNGLLFGRLTEHSLAGVAVPNPKKAFIGRSILGSQGIRFCFVGAHFPITSIAQALEAPGATNPLRDAKIAFARVLRKVLRKACKKGLADERTAIFVQGDLNSRTVLQGPEAHDVLLDLLRDDEMQQAIQHELPIPPGRWCEVVEHDSVHDLPVTYKFLDNISEILKDCPALTVGDVLSTARHGSLGSDALPEKEHSSGSEFYKRTLTAVSDEKVAEWGLVFKKHDFRAFRFPACADRIIYWAPNSLARRMSWTFPRGGYEVNHAQGGSDHRPVSLEAELQIAPEGDTADNAGDSGWTEGKLPYSQSLPTLVCAQDVEEGSEMSPVPDEHSDANLTDDEFEVHCPRDFRGHISPLPSFANKDTVLDKRPRRDSSEHDHPPSDRDAFADEESVGAI
eukprot:gnl/TRDRNA2_/TRDRNA2_152554_c1_seq1.p1 gnl/TRDRNA2_/TRDRNA2_152554_c1~~gnl/TRDRNA2_/TRDRNA2_152554_c1_seq1.p1  ORF type:complete len:595 (+),score=107.19 gnl/TRDRNA2_/TRDRNA2_152554_c1_seq1:132-1916(+)